MISEAEISQVREATDLVSLIGARVVLKPRRNEFWGCCPFHNEKTASFKVDPVSQFYHCFGCGESGDAFTFTMKTENVDFPESVRILAARANIELAEDAQGYGKGRKARLYQVVEATADFYHQQIMRVKSNNTDAARSYLATRGMGGEVAKKWKLGFAPGHGQLAAHLTSLGFTAQEMADVDVVRLAGSGQGRTSDRFFDRIIFPIFDIQGRAIGFGGRVFLPDDTSQAKYLNSAETLLFKKRDNLYAIDMAKSAIVNNKSAIVVEGYTDTIALHQAGFANTVATLGTALTAQHLRLLARFTERVVLLFDGDEAGLRAADRAMDLIEVAGGTAALTQRQADVYVALLPGNADPAEFVVAQGSEALNGVLDSAQPLVRYGLDRTLARYDLNQPEQRNRALTAALQLLRPLQGTVLASDYLSYLANVFNMDTQAESDMNNRFRSLRQSAQARRANSEAAGAGGTAAVAGSGEASGAASGAGSFGDAAGAQLSNQAAMQHRIIEMECDLLYIYVQQPGLREQLNRAFTNTIWLSDDHRQLAEILVTLPTGEDAMEAAATLAYMTARIPEATASLAAARFQNLDEPSAARLADRLLFNIRETKLEAAINRINGERRVLPKDDPKNLELFEQLATLQKELAELRLRNKQAG